MQSSGKAALRALIDTNPEAGQRKEMWIMMLNWENLRGWRRGPACSLPLPSMRNRRRPWSRRRLPASARSCAPRFRREQLAVTRSPRYSKWCFSTISRSNIPPAKSWRWIGREESRWSNCRKAACRPFISTLRRFRSTRAGHGWDTACNLFGPCEGDATMKSYAFIALAGVMVLSACAQTPMGSTVPVMPGPNTSLASFHNDQATCQQFAQ